MPGISDLLLALFHRLLNPAQLGIAEAVVSCQLDSGLQPKLCLAVN
jgi:hypothetical protein